LIEYRDALSSDNKDTIEKDVAAKFVVTLSALRQWRNRLRETFGDLAVKRELSFARNAASHELAHHRLVGAPPSPWDVRYGDCALVQAADAYKKALRARPKKRASKGS
jgi:hypothetical protein